MAVLDQPLFAPDRLPPPPPEVKLPPPPPPPPDPLESLQIFGLYQDASIGGMIGKINGRTQRLTVGQNLATGHSTQWSRPTPFSREMLKSGVSNCYRLTYGGLASNPTQIPTPTPTHLRRLPPKFTTRNLKGRCGKKRRGRPAAAKTKFAQEQVSCPSAIEAAHTTWLIFPLFPVSARRHSS